MQLPRALPALARPSHPTHSRHACSNGAALAVATAWGSAVFVHQVSLAAAPAAGGEPSPNQPSAALPATLSASWSEAQPVACLHWMEGPSLSVVTSAAAGPATMLLRDAGGSGVFDKQVHSAACLHWLEGPSLSAVKSTAAGRATMLLRDTGASVSPGTPHGACAAQELHPVACLHWLEGPSLSTVASAATAPAAVLLRHAGASCVENECAE